jgi:hypothetical protein
LDYCKSLREGREAKKKWEVAKYLEQLKFLKETAELDKEDLLAEKEQLEIKKSELESLMSERD